MISPVQVIPPLVLERFGSLPGEIIDVCRTLEWPALSSPPREGVRSIRDILAHMISSERGWIHYVVLEQDGSRLRPRAFEGLDAMLAVWRPQRNATIALAGRLTPDEWGETRPLPWDDASTATVAEIFWHVITHEHYHRGQIFTRLALLGARDLPDLDLLR